MIDNCKLVLDIFSEVYDLLKPWADDEFYDFKLHSLHPGAIYLIGRAQFNLNKEYIRDLVEQKIIQVILSNPAEGSDTLKSHCENVHGCADLVQSKQILLVGGGDMDPSWPCLRYDVFLPKVLDYEENLAAIDRAQEIYTKTNKPYKFLFLNGRMRGHRKFLLEKFDSLGLLDSSIWTCLEEGYGNRSNLTLIHDGKDLMQTHRGIKLLDPQYEVDRYRDLSTTNSGFVKYDLFKKEWGDIYLTPEPYIDTFFSVVTETVYDYPYSFRTEKIWKPIAIGHPFIVATSTGYYRDLKNLGFKTFGHLIDESFDSIDNHTDRFDRLARIVTDLCCQNLPSFLSAAEEVCKYNQQHLAEMRIRVRQEFPDRFFQFMKQNNII